MPDMAAATALLGYRDIQALAPCQWTRGAWRQGYDNPWTEGAIVLIRDARKTLLTPSDCR